MPDRNNFPHLKFFYDVLILFLSPTLSVVRMFFSAIFICVCVCTVCVCVCVCGPSLLTQRATTTQHPVALEIRNENWILCVPSLRPHTQTWINEAHTETRGQDERCLDKKAMFGSGISELIP